MRGAARVEKSLASTTPGRVEDPRPIHDPARRSRGRVRRGAELLWRLTPSLLFVVVAVCVWLWIADDAFGARVATRSPSSDYWEHSATLRALIENPFHPQNPHLVSPYTSPRFGPLFVAIALSCRVFDLDALGAMGVSACLNTALFLLGIFSFFRSYFQSSWAPLYALVILFGSWWTAWNYSNVYQLSIFFSVAGYPSTAALGLTLICFTLELAVLRARRERLSLLALLAILWAAILITHPLTAMMALSGGFLLAVTARYPSMRRRFAVLATLLVGCLLTFAWPYFSTFEVLRGGNAGAQNYWVPEAVNAIAEGGMDQPHHHFYKIGGVQNTLGWAQLGIPICIYLLVRRRHLFIPLGALSMGVPYLANLYVPVPLGHRFILLAVFFLQLALVWFLLRLAPVRVVRREPWVRRLRAPLGALCVALFLFQLSSDAIARGLRVYDRHSRASPVVRLAHSVARAAGPNSVVLADARAAWALPTFGPKVVNLLHSNPLVFDEGQRNADVRTFFRGSRAAQRMVLARYGVTHVLVKRSRERAVSAALGRGAQRRIMPGGFVLYAVPQR